MRGKCCKFRFETDTQKSKSCHVLKGLFVLGLLPLPNNVQMLARKKVVRKERVMVKPDGHSDRHLHAHKRSRFSPILECPQKQEAVIYFFH